MILEPSLDVQTAIRSALIADEAVTALVDPNAIRSGSTRPDGFPCIRIGDASTAFLGRCAGGQYSARVGLDLHIWAIQDGADTAKRIGSAVGRALIQIADDQASFSFDDFDQPSIIWLTDPDPAVTYTHGVVSVDCVIRWQT